MIARVRQSLAVGEKHRHTGPIYRGIEDLSRLVWEAYEGQTWLVKRGEVASREIVAQDRRRLQKRLHAYKHLGSSCLPEIPTMEPASAR